MILCVFFLMHVCFAQNERSIVRDGNKNYDKGLFSDSEINYRKSLSKNKGFEEAQFNLADALFKQDRYDESINVLNNLISETDNTNLKSEAYYNLGNNLLQKQQLENAVDAYKNCLRLNPSDEEARYNLSKVMSLMQQQEQNEEQQEQNEEQENQNSGETSDQNQEEEDQSSGETSDQSDDKKDSSLSNDSEEDQENKSKEPNESSNEELSREEIERILDALEREEQRVQSEIQKSKQNGKQKLLEKDW